MSAFSVLGYKKGKSGGLLMVYGLGYVVSGPEFLFASVFHESLTFWAGVMIPDAYFIAAALQT